MILPLLLCFLVVSYSTHALRPSHRAPVLFVVTTLDTNQSEFRGTSIRTDGEWRFGHIDEATQDRIHAVFPMATVLSVNTDDEAGNKNHISEWMHRECGQIQRRQADDCYVLSLTQDYAPYRTAVDPYEFRRWESALKQVVKHALKPLEIKPLGSARPTYALTPSPVVSPHCESRTEVDCVDSTCTWNGMFHGCRTGLFCGFASKMACEHQSGCTYTRGRCRVILKA